LPADQHVHSEWSWDTVAGSMERTCARAVELGLPALAFTEHVGEVRWPVAPEALAGGYEHLLPLIGEDGLMTQPPLDIEGYLACLERCRDRFPQLRILGGVECGEPHRNPALAERFGRDDRFDRVLGSLHCVPDGDGFAEPPELFASRPADAVIRDYLAEVAVLLDTSPAFDVLAHIDYPVRYWPAAAGPFDAKAFEDEYRHALARLAASGRALEVNTQVPLPPVIVTWWREAGGRAVTFGSDAHRPDTLARGFAAAAALVEGPGVRPGRDPSDAWLR
jgi:histidinol-phosphatase (PHP family)